MTWECYEWIGSYLILRYDLGICDEWLRDIRENSNEDKMPEGLYSDLIDTNLKQGCKPLKPRRLASFGERKLASYIEDPADATMTISSVEHRPDKVASMKYL
jgi:hypothetical protein